MTTNTNLGRGFEKSAYLSQQQMILRTFFVTLKAASVICVGKATFCYYLMCQFEKSFLENPELCTRNAWKA
jgi:hypothetical protein